MTRSSISSSHSQLLYIDKIQQVLVLEHLNGAESLLAIGDGLGEIIGHLTLVVVSLFINFTSQCFVAQTQVCRELDIKLSLFLCFYF